MRCPKCKAKLISAGKKRYETLSEHVSDPNKKTHPLRETYQCPNRCFFVIKGLINLPECLIDDLNIIGMSDDEIESYHFWGYEGAVYVANSKFYELKKEPIDALDSMAREIEISVQIEFGGSYRHHSHELKRLRVKGEKDIPACWKWRFIWLKVKYYQWRAKRRRSKKS